jgi:ActR/RegA family two-component response regulator
MKEKCTAGETQMNPRLILLLTHDREFENLLTEAVLATGAAGILVARTVDDALHIVCTRGRELDFAVIDFDDGCHGMTLLSALDACRHGLQVVVVTSQDVYHAAAVAYANGVAACLAKPIAASDLEIVIRELRHPKLELEAA